MDTAERIELNPQVLAGKPVVRGTRVAVEDVLELLATGVSTVDILSNYPRLTEADLRACIAYAATLVKEERAYPTHPAG